MDAPRTEGFLSQWSWKRTVGARAAHGTLHACVRVCTRMHTCACVYACAPVHICALCARVC